MPLGAGAVASKPSVAAVSDPPMFALSALRTITRRKRYSPGNNAKVDYSHPFARKLVLAAPTYPVIDLVKQRVATTGNGNELQASVASAYGAGGRTITGGTTDGMSNALSTDLDFASGPFTVLAMGWYNTNLGANYPVAIGRYSYTSESVNSGWNLIHSQTTGWTFSTYNNNAAASYALNQGTDIAGGQYMVAGTSDGTTKRLYIDGKQIGSTTNSPNPLTNAFSRLMFGFENSASGTISLTAAFAWNRCLAAREIATLYTDPFCFIIPKGH